MNEDNCKSVYLDGEACVFGVDDVTAFEEGELVTPDPRQVLRVKGENINCYYANIILCITSVHE